MRIGVFDRDWNKPVSIAPLIVFRILFGCMMAASIVRFTMKGWISDLYIDPVYYFSYWGLDWIKPLPGLGMYFIFAFMFFAAVGIMLGSFYKISSWMFFILFTYVELIDKTNYLNHYYFVSLVAFLLCLVPAHRDLSVDSWIGRVPGATQVPTWTIGIFKIQLGLVYFFAGLAKINYDWLIEAMPLKLWLPAVSHTPFIGFIFNYEWSAYLLSWLGAIYDLVIPFLLLWSLTRGIAYFFVVIFHLMTAALFQIGVFPYVMIVSTLIFFSNTFHLRIVHYFKRIFHWKPVEIGEYLAKNTKITRWAITVFFVVQAALPLRYLLYPDHLFWTEEGYRFSWRVMLMEKSGHTTFKIKDALSDKSEWVANYRYLTSQQEKMMSTQPDMILQYAHFLQEEYEKKGFLEPQVFCNSKVTLNGQRSRVFVDPDRDLALERESLRHKDWITPWKK